MSDEKLHNGTNKMDENLRRSFDSWDSGDAPDMWQNLDESLSVEKVWMNMSESLGSEKSGIDDQLRSGFDNWKTESPSDIWTKLDESLSVEKVWTSLDSSLVRPVTSTRSSWFRIAAACILVLFFVRNVNDQSFNFASERFEHKENAGLNQVEVSASVEKIETVSGSYSATNQILEAENSGGRKLTSLRGNVVKPSSQQNNEENRDGRIVAQDENQTYAPVDLISNSVATLDSVRTEDKKPELISDLAPKRYAHGFGLETLNFPKVKERYDHVLIQVGAQFANLQIANASSLSSSRTRIGLAADVAWRQRFGNLQLTGVLGVSQFQQQQGNYVNARYQEAQQKINMAQLSVCLGYNFKRIHFYGGPMLSNALTAVEFNEGKITQVYTFKTVEPGITAGIDYKLFNLRGKSNGLLIGAQYQYIPDNRLNENLNQIHGLRIQTKFSF